jgi:hypothetical protein
MRAVQLAAGCSAHLFEPDLNETDPGCLLLVRLLSWYVTTMKHQARIACIRKTVGRMMVEISEHFQFLKSLHFLLTSTNFQSQHAVLAHVLNALLNARGQSARTWLTHRTRTSFPRADQDRVTNSLISQ